MQLVQHEEAQPRTVADDAAIDILLPRHEEFQHHEVGEQDVRRVVRNALPLVHVLLAGVAGEGDRSISGHLTDELGEFVHLRVRERVHRVDDDGVRSSLGGCAARLQDVVDDGDEEAERLPGSRAGRHHEALTLGGQRDRLLLVLVEGQGLAVRAEDVRAAWVQDIVRDQGADVRRAPVARIDLDERLRPVALFGVDALDLLADVPSVDGRERRREALVLADDVIAEGEHVERRGGA